MQVHSSRQAHNQVKLPQPGAEAQAASAALQQLIRAEIQSSGAIPFARFMELVLYTPGLGYYSGGASKLGKDGDFTTAPEISPLFGASLAQVMRPLLQQAGGQIMEFGAGSGKLAHDILQELQGQGVAVEKYYILELSGELRARQQQALARFPQVEWLDALPSTFNGVVLGNEVLDAMPVHLLQKEDTGWQEVLVGLAEDGQFAWQQQAAGPELMRQLALQIPQPEALPPGYLTELHPSACAFIRSVAHMLSAGRGAAVFIDYGFAAHEYYLPQRRNGTLMCHYRHHSHDQPFYWPGLQDITAHVEFSTLAACAREGGLDVLSYSNQAGFLLEAGITRLLERSDASDARNFLPQANAVGKLLATHEMGELFKVLVLGCGLSLAPDWGRFARQLRL